MQKTTDQAQLADIARGDRSALEQLYLAYKDDILTLAVWMLGNQSAAEDVLHDVVVSIAKNAPNIRLKGPLKHYLMRAATNRCRDLMRQKKLDTLPTEQLIPDPSPDSYPLNTLHAAEQHQRLDSAVRHLPAEQRQVITLRIHGRMRFRQIAQLLEISINTAQSRYRYALKTLQRTLNPNEVSP